LGLILIIFLLPHIKVVMVVGSIMKPTTKKTSLLSVCDVTERTKQLCSKKEKKRRAPDQTENEREKETREEARGDCSLKKKHNILFIYLFIYLCRM